MSEPWCGTSTALVTPFDRRDALDESAVRRLVEFQVDGGVDGLVTSGATGEGASLTFDEQVRIAEIARKQADGRIAVMASVGAGATKRGIELGRRLESVGIDALLCSIPSFHRPSQEGIYQHVARLADDVQVPVIVSNVPSRTGTGLLVETVLRLARHGNVRGLDDSSGDLMQAMQLLAEPPPGFSVLAGDDDLAFPLLALGAHGVISVVANEVPMVARRMVRDGLEGRLSDARELHYRLFGLMRAHCVEINPVPVKAALAMMGLIDERYRLPLLPLDEQKREILRRQLSKLELVGED